MSTPSRVELTEMGAAHIAASAARQATWRRLLRLRWGVGAAGVLLLIVASALCEKAFARRQAALDYSAG